jgi:hypothetical protein
MERSGQVPQTISGSDFPLCRSKGFGLLSTKLPIITERRPPASLTVEKHGYFI